jgi:CheY-specific phosphatase CheX
LSENELREAITGSTSQVLENMFFAEPLDGNGTAPADPVQSGIEFEGSVSGAMTVSVDRACADRLACDFLGVEAGEISEQQVVEVLTELTNMICGALMSRFETGSTLTLTQPEIVAEDWHAERPGWLRQSFDLGDGTLAVAVSLGHQ